MNILVMDQEYFIIIRH